MPPVEKKLRLLKLSAEKGSNLVRMFPQDLGQGLADALDRHTLRVEEDLIDCVPAQPDVGAFLGL